MKSTSIDLTPFLQFTSQVKILHWKAKSKSHHDVLGNIYDEMESKIDEFIECYSGKPIPVLMVCADIPIEITQEDDLTSFCKIYDAFKEEVVLLVDGNSTLSSLVDDMTNICTRGMYLLKMS